MEVPDPAGSLTAETTRSAALTVSASLDGYPHVVYRCFHSVGTCSDEPSLAQLDWMPTPGFEPGSRPREGRWSDYTTSAPQSPRPESNRRPPDPNSGVPRQRRLRGSTQPQLSLRSCELATSVRSARTEPVRPCIGTNTDHAVTSLTPRARSVLCAGHELIEGRWRSRVPQPLTGTPYGGRVIRENVSGERRIAATVRRRR